MTNKKCIHGKEMICVKCGDDFTPIPMTNNTETMEETPKQVLEGIFGINLVGNEFTPQNVIRIHMAFREEVKRETLQARQEERNLVLELVKEEVEKLKRTDETQMNEDHVYDEALGDISTLVDSLKIK